MRFVLRHSGILLLEALAGLLALAILAGGILAILLKDQAPLQLGFLTPYLERSLNEIDPNIKVKIAETLLTWSGWERPLDLRVRNVQISDAAGHSLANLPDLSVELSVPALLGGDIAPGAIDVVAPRLVVVRTEDGRMQLGFGQSEQEVKQPLTPDLAAVLLQPARGPGHLRRIMIQQASVIVIDRRAGEVWRLPGVNFELRRSRFGAKAAVNATLLQKTGTAFLNAQLSVPAGEDPAAVNVEVAGLDPRTLAVLTKIPEIERLRLTVGGALAALVARSGQVEELKFSLAAGPGAIELPDIYTDPLPVAGANLRGRFFDGFNQLELDGASLTVTDGPTVTVSGVAKGLSSNSIELQAHLGSGPITTDALLHYWPAAFAHNARDWISHNITGGQAHQGEADLALTVPRDDPTHAVLEHAEGTFRASGLTVNYVDGLPPLQEVAGEGKFAGNKLVLNVNAGHVGKLVLTGGTVEVAGLDTEPQIVTIDGNVTGPVRDGLVLIDYDRLGYPRKMGIDPKSASGSGTVHLWFRLPAHKSVHIDEVNLRVEAQLTDVAMSEAAFGVPINSGDLDLMVERTGMTLEGTAVVAGTSTRLKWQENFGSGAFDTQLTADATPDEEVLAKVGFNPAPWAAGRIPLHVVYTRTGANATANVVADLTQATLTAEPIAWRKEAGVRAEARATVALNKRQVTGVSDIRLAAGDLNLTGSVTPGNTNTTPTRLSFDQLAWGNSRLDKVEIELSKPTQIRIGGGSLDAGPFLERRKEHRVQTAEPGPAFHIVAPQLTELRTGADRALVPASFDLANNGERWEWLVLSGGMPGGKTMSLQYGLDPITKGRSLHLTTDDAGALLRTAKLLETVVGGSLTIDGEAKEPGLSQPLPIQVEVKDYRVVRGTVMAKILQQAKLEDINKLLAREGIPFARFTGKMVLKDTGIEIVKARAYGAALGITAAGNIDVDNGRLDLQGTIVPAYVVSQIVGEIPLLGRILTGGEGEGLFAATYRATGPLDNPDVSVNPLAALAPGFLRGIFNIFQGSGGTNQGDEDFTPLPPRENK